MPVSFTILEKKCAVFLLRVFLINRCWQPFVNQQPSLKVVVKRLWIRVDKMKVLNLHQNIIITSPQIHTPNSNRTLNK